MCEHSARAVKGKCLHLHSQSLVILTLSIFNHNIISHTHTCTFVYAIIINIHTCAQSKSQGSSSISMGDKAEGMMCHDLHNNSSIIKFNPFEKGKKFSISHPHPSATQRHLQQLMPHRAHIFIYAYIYLSPFPAAASTFPLRSPLSLFRFYSCFAPARRTTIIKCHKMIVILIRVSVTHTHTRARTLKHTKVIAQRAEE